MAPRPRAMRRAESISQTSRAMVWSSVSSSPSGLPQPRPTLLIAGNSAAGGGGPIYAYDSATGAAMNSFVPTGAFIDFGLFRRGSSGGERGEK